MSEDQQKVYNWLIGMAAEVKEGKFGYGESFEIDEFLVDVDLAILEL
ncbi:hypothetical protein LCGC14_2559260 [marine sediment metagenome]|uniref:Uncharacterized protein n=1 Tax=marine sediment metagenome TaxID=412755 RepID=A0A0F9DDL0_9ZZZZ